MLEKKIFSSLRAGKAELDDQTLSNKNEQRINQARVGRTWMGSTNAEVEYFSREEDRVHVSFASLDTPESVMKRLQEMKVGGYEVVGVDIMGQGDTCADFGCDETFAITLPTPNFEEKEQIDKEEAMGRNVHIKFGDVFSESEKDDFLVELNSHLDQEKKKLGLVFFRPWSGMEAYQANEYSHLYLYENIFKPLYNALTINGVMFLELFSIDDAEFNLLVDHLEKNGVWTRTPHRREDENGVRHGLRVLRIEKPLVTRQDLPQTKLDRFGI